MSLYTRFYASVVFPLHETLKGHDSVAWRQRLDRGLWLTAEALESLQSDRVRLSA